MTGVDDTGVVGLADRLWRAEVDRAPIAPITGRPARPDGRGRLRDPGPQRPAAGRRGRAWSAGAAWAGRPGRGRTSSASTSPTSAFCSTTCSSTRATRSRSSCCSSPGSWPTMAFVLATDLAGPGVTIADALTAVAGVMPAIEIVDSRIADWQVQLADTVADNASRGQGRPRRPDHPGHRRRPAAARGAALPQRGADRERAGAAALGNPARCVAWLANKLGSTRLAGCAAATSCCRAAAPHGAGPAGRLLPGRVRAPGHGDGAVPAGPT